MENAPIMCWKMGSCISGFQFNGYYNEFPYTTVLVAALEKVEKSSGSLIGSSIATIQKSTAPEVI